MNDGSYHSFLIQSLYDPQYEGKMPGIKNRCTVCGWNYKCGRFVADVVRADALHPGWTKIFYPNYLEDCRRRNILVHVWTINNEKDMRRCCEMGLDAIITNYPDVARKVVDEYQLN